MIRKLPEKLAATLKHIKNEKNISKNKVLLCLLIFTISDQVLHQSKIATTNTTTC